MKIKKFEDDDDLKTFYNERKCYYIFADANYFELLNELVDSIKRFKESKNTAICIMDAGLTDEQKSILS